MTITWAHSPSNNVYDAAAAVEQALLGVEHSAPSAPQAEDLFEGDLYLAENVSVMRAKWEVNPWTVSATDATLIGRAFLLFQRGVRRLSWWYSRPQIDQVNLFHAASVRTLDALLARVLRLSERLHNLEAIQSDGRLKGLEEQLRATRESNTALICRITELETEVARLREG